MPRNYYVNEGNKLGYQDAQPLGVEQKKLVAKAPITKGQCVSVSGDWEVEVTTDLNAGKFIGVCFHDAKAGEAVMVDTEGLVKLDASESITAGAEVTPTAGGAVKIAGADNKIIGIAISTATVGEAVYVKLR